MASNVAVLERPQCEELHVSQGGVALCLLVNRRTRTVRVIDFRAGPSLLKREIVQRIALEERLERAFTVVEREEAASWLRLGFHKEGSIPGFYKRTDAQVLGMALAGDPGQPLRPKRLTLAALAHDTTDGAERAYQAGRKLARARLPTGSQTLAGATLPSVRLQPARGVDVVRSVTAAVRSGRALTELEPFGRGGERLSYLATARGSFSQLLSVECQPCFDNAFVELLTAPRSESEAWFVAAALQQLATVLEAQELRSVFAMSPAESVETTAALVAAGFRRTGRMPRHLLAQGDTSRGGPGGERQDALLWSRRLGDPAWEH